MSSNSSSTESINSIAASSDGEDKKQKKMDLKDVQNTKKASAGSEDQPKKKAVRLASTDKPPPPRPPPPRSMTIDKDDTAGLKRSDSSKNRPARPPPPRSITLAASNSESSAASKRMEMHKQPKAQKPEKFDENKENKDDVATVEVSKDKNEEEPQVKTGVEGEAEEEEEQKPSKWKSFMNPVTGIWSATASAASRTKEATVNAASAAKDATVNAAVKTKDVTVNAAVKTKDATVNAAVATKDATVNAAVKTKDVTVNAATATKDATVNAAVATKDATYSAGSNVGNKFANVVVLAKKAAKETKHRMGPATDSLTIIHFNDVYNVESRESQEPVGGAARFVTAVKKFDHLSPMILFSGDIFAPSIMSTFTKGEQMVPVLNRIGVHCACYGNHDFDFGIDTLMDLSERTTFPWMISNVTDNETGRPLAEGKVTQVLEWWGRKIGLMGLVEKEWLDTLSTINPEEVTYTDYAIAGKLLAKELREKGCDYVIALTHMRTPNDERLAQEVEGIDLILGGHDHVYERKKVNGKHILKSGTDFRQFSVITVKFDSGDNDEEESGEGKKEEKAETKVKRVVTEEIEAVEVTAEYEPDKELTAALEKYTEKMEGEMCKELGEFEVELDGRFSSVRTRETNLGNFVCDIMVAALHADFALLNSGTLRSDTLHQAGPFFLKDLLTILPMIDPLVLVEVTGAQVLECLENGVSQYPKLEGRFPQVSGISFAFDPKKPSGSRVDQQFVKIGDEYIDPKRTYTMATKAYIATGKDGYDTLANSKQLVDEENGPTLVTAVQNHFKAIAMKEGKTRRSSVHHQSLVTMSRRTSIVRQLTEDGTHKLPAHLPENLKSMDLGPKAKPKIGKQATIADLESTSLRPRIHGRIVILNQETFLKLQNRKEKDLRGEVIPEEDEDIIGPQGQNLEGEELR